MKTLYAFIAVLLSIPAAAAPDDARLDRFLAEEDGAHALSDRLFMYWNSRATDVFVRDEATVGAGGERAPVPTVMFSGARSHVTAFLRPTVEELPRRAEDERGLFLAPRAGGGKQWVCYGQTGTMIESLNNEIISLAAKLAKRADEPSRVAAFNVLDTYLSGILHRNIPTDLAHGHLQTLFGMQSMETIHDNALHSVCELYRTMKPWVRKNHPERLADMQNALRKWAQVQIDNGVADNNWDMMQLDFILDVALVLEPDSAYPDGRGREHFVDVVLNQSSVRNLSITALVAKGYDENTGIWFECPGYSMVVLNDLSRFATRLADELDIDIFALAPVLEKAYLNATEYLFPDSLLIGFGDTHPSPLPKDAYLRMEKIARRFNRTALADRLGAIARNSGGEVKRKFFYAPNASWLVARTGMDPASDIAFALNGSLGNHQHANGISLELFAKGYRLAPDAGIGWSLYSGDDYREYYSQFPAHNTVMVNSRSTYQVMKSFHPFTLVSHTDDSATVSFREPATGAEQLRTVKMVKDGDGAYFVDIFRSRIPQNASKDEWHDYYYHNLADELEIEGTLAPTEEIAFQESGLYCLSYIKEKFTRAGTNDLAAVFRWARPEGSVDMRVFMNGAEGRTFIKAMAPATEGLSRVKKPDYAITRESRTPVLVVRQRGEAWSRPFIAVFDPSGTVESVEYLPDVVRITRRNGKCDVISFQ